MNKVKGFPHQVNSEEFTAIGPLIDPIPWDEPVDGRLLLQILVDRFNNYLSLPPGADVVSALWIFQMAMRWTMDNTGRIDPNSTGVPEEITIDSVRDNLRVLLSIADIIGGEWPGRAREAAILLSEPRKEQYSPEELILVDIKTIFDGRRISALETHEILTFLSEIESRQWSNWSMGKPITAAALAELLGDNTYDIHPRKWRAGKKTARGYWRQDFEDAFRRYVPEPPPSLFPPHYPVICDMVGSGNPGGADPAQPPVLSNGLEETQ